MHDTEDKEYWLRLGLEKEHTFITQTAVKLGLTIIMNPAKSKNPKAIDFIYQSSPESYVPADLKTQNTPFFTSGRVEMNPESTVTFNLKDLEYYERVYPDAVIFFHVHWTVLTGRYGGQTYTVPPLNGVWRTTVVAIRGAIERARVQHDYKRRVNDTQGNARASYLLSLDEMTLIGLL